MSKISWLAKKKYDISNIDKLLTTSRDSNQFTNLGPMVKKLEQFFTDKLKVDPDRCVIAVANGALGLHALTAGIDLYQGKKKQYITSDFTFPCSAQGYLIDSIICDVDSTGNLDLEKIHQGDGLIVTNLFGHVSNVDKYLEFCNNRGWPCIFDNACASYTVLKGKNVVNYGDGCIISLHHTKPIGFGEGGLIIAKKEYESCIRKLVNFGFEIKKGQVEWHAWGNNAKMSDISAAFIYDYLETNFDRIVSTNKQLYKHFKEKCGQLENFRLLSDFSDDIPFVNCLPLICKHEITGEHLHILELYGITARKYYTPLKGLQESSRLFKHILCLPINVDMTVENIEYYLKILKEI